MPLGIRLLRASASQQAIGEEQPPLPSHRRAVFASAIGGRGIWLRSLRRYGGALASP